MTYFRQIIDDVTETITVPLELRHRRVEIIICHWMMLSTMGLYTTNRRLQSMRMVGLWASLKKPLARFPMSLNASHKVIMKYGKNGNEIFT